MQKIKIKNVINVFLAFFSFACIVILLLELSRKNMTHALPLFKILDIIVIFIFSIDIISNLITDFKTRSFLRQNFLSLFILASYFFLSSWAPVTGIDFLGKNFSLDYLIRISILLRLSLLTLTLFSKTKSVRSFFAGLRLKPAQSIVFGFIAVIFFGAIILSLPISVQNGKALSLTDAVFTSTSAVCVTGLIVVDTGSYFSTFGQTIILLLIQVGGLGIMTLAVFIGLILGERISIRERQVTQNVLDQGSASSILGLIKKIIKITFIIEFLGAAAIFIYHLFIPHPSITDISQLIFYSFFHSISAFCNAGFSLNTNSLTLLSGNIFGNGIFMILIITGSIGFTVIINLKNKASSLFKRKEKSLNTIRGRLTLHTKMVLIITVVLLISGAVLFYISEYDNSLAEMNPFKKLYISAFQSTTTRTAGFNTINFSDLRPVTFLIMIFFMFIGASPGSTGGGIKTTTFYLMLLTIVTMIKEQKEVKIFKRHIPRDIINKAVAITVLSIALVFTSSLIIMFIETDFHFLNVVFEVVSAAATVGLSTGITPSLSTGSKIVIIITMFLGRIGPLTLVLAMSRQKADKNLIRLPEEKIMVG